MEEKRKIAREIARTHLDRGDALGWFEALYRAANGDAGIVPWADQQPNPGLIDWLDKERIFGGGKKALKIGCGLGDDAEALADRGFNVTAFDISQTAVSWCRSRFPKSEVGYQVKDLFDAPASWYGAFDLVLESYTLQVLPPDIRAESISRISQFVAPEGTLLVICRGREPGEHPGHMPWPLTRIELDGFKENGLKEIGFEDFVDEEEPPVRRFRIVYKR
jgi:SAM-dependent methyltransferase